jgi:hypothetical protein
VAGEGKNKNVFISRRGVVVDMPVAWGHCNTTETAWRARDLAVERGVKVVNFDANSSALASKGRGIPSRGACPFEGMV